MGDPVYEAIKDLVVPGLSGIGSVIFGLGAVLAAGRANDVAEQVRGDEQKREAYAARQRYEDQLFRTIEPTVAAFLVHRSEIATSRTVRTVPEQLLATDVIARLRLVQAVVNENDKPLLDAIIRSYRDAIEANDWEVLVSVTGSLAIQLPALLVEGLNIPATVRVVDALVPDAVAAAAADAGGDAGATT